MATNRNLITVLKEIHKDNIALDEYEQRNSVGFIEEVSTLRFLLEKLQLFD